MINYCTAERTCQQVRCSGVQRVMPVQARPVTVVRTPPYPWLQAPTFACAMRTSAHAPHMK